LFDIGAGGIPQLEVYNKIDLRQDDHPRVDYDADGLAKRVWISAHDGRGVDALRGAIAQHLSRHFATDLAGPEGEGDGVDAEYDDSPGDSSDRTGGGQPSAVRIRLEPSAGRLHARLFEWKVVRHESTNE